MQSSSRIKRKIPLVRNKSDQRKEDSLDITPISLKRQEIKLPSITTKATPRRDQPIQFNSTPKKSQLNFIRHTPSPQHAQLIKSMHSDLSLNLQTKRLQKPRINSIELPRLIENTASPARPGERNHRRKEASMNISPRFLEGLKKFATNFLHSSSSDVSSEDNAKEDSKKFESPALWQAGVNSISSYVSESSYLKQASNNRALNKCATFEEVEELSTTPDVNKYSELMFKLIVQDSITDGVKGRIRQWRSGEILGVGTYAQVFKAFDINSGELFAVKRILFNPNNKTQASFIKTLEDEVRILQGLHRKHIVKYLGSESIQDNFCIYLEYLPGGSLSKLLYNLGALSEITVRAYLTQILKGLVYLHNSGVIHRDIKGANILLDSKGKVKLSDFGCSKQYTSGDSESGLITSLKGSLPWMAPEVIKQKGYGRKADIWSLGCVALEMLTANKPWGNEDNHIAFMMKIISDNTIPEIPEGISESARDFLMNCFQRDPKLRKSAKELLEHTFVKKLGV